jgi:ribosomal-protein-alanine N-acetyltransferase
MAERLIRDLAEDDLPQLMELERACFPTPWTENMFRCQLALGEISANLACIEEGELAGYIIAWFGYEEVHILSIGVIPGRRGAGIADALLDEALRISSLAGCEKAILEVRSGNSRAQAFYRRHGFRQVGLRKGYYSENNEDALVLEKEIG